jgi:hypothetical protein
MTSMQEDLDLLAFSPPLSAGQTYMRPEGLPLKAVYRDALVGIRYLHPLAAMHNLNAPAVLVAAVCACMRMLIHVLQTYRRFQVTFASTDAARQFVNSISAVCPCRANPPPTSTISNPSSLSQPLATAPTIAQTLNNRGTMPPPSSRPSSASSDLSITKQLSLRASPSCTTGSNPFASASAPRHLSVISHDQPSPASAPVASDPPNVPTLMSTASSLPSSSPPPYSSSVQSRVASVRPPPSSSTDLRTSLLMSFREPSPSANQSQGISGPQTYSLKTVGGLSWAKELSDKELENLVVDVITSEGFTELV